MARRRGCIYTPHQSPAALPHLQTVADDEIPLSIKVVSQGAARTQVSQGSQLAKPGAAASCAVMSRLCLPERVEFVQHVKTAILAHLHALCTGNSMWAMKCSSEDCVIDAIAVQVAGHPGHFLHRQVVGLLNCTAARECCALQTAIPCLLRTPRRKAHATVCHAVQAAQGPQAGHTAPGLTFQCRGLCPPASCTEPRSCWQDRRLALFCISST